MTVSGRTVLVTGATGFLGSAVANRFANEGFGVRATGRQVQPQGLGRADYRPFDLTGPDTGDSLFAGVDAVVNCAGLAHRFRVGDDADFRRVNVDATARLVEAAARAGVRHFVHVSSVSVYGPGSGEGDESTPCRPMGAYAESKREAEQAAARAAYRSSLRLVILRMPTLYGRGDPGNLARLIRALDRGRFVWIGTGANRKNLLHREDAAQACFLAMIVSDGRTGANVPPETFNVPSDVKTVREIVGEIVRALGRRPPRFRIPAGPITVAAQLAKKISPLAPFVHSVEKWLQDDCFDGTRFYQRTGFRHAVSLREGIAEEVAWTQETLRER